MKFSNIVRWILVLPAILAVFCVEIFVTSLLPGFKSDLWGIVCLIILLLTGLTVAPLHGKRFLAAVASLFIFSCLIPPWQYTVDRYGLHSRNPAGYSLLIAPPINPDRTVGSGVQIDFGRLFVEWAALATVAGVAWLFAVKPMWPRDDKANRPQKFTPPTGNSKN